MKFIHKRLPSMGEEDQGSINIKTQLSNGYVTFGLPSVFNEGSKGVEGTIHNAGGEECGLVRGAYFLKGDVFSWDGYSGDSFQIWQAAEEDPTAWFVAKNMLKVSRPLNKCFFVQFLCVREEDKGKMLGVESILAIFDYFHQKHGAKSMAGEIFPHQHLDPPYEGKHKTGRFRGTTQEDTIKLAGYLDRELNLSFFGKNFWIHGPTRNHRLNNNPWKEPQAPRRPNRTIVWAGSQPLVPGLKTQP